MSATQQEALLRAANHFERAHARLGGELYPDDLREFAKGLAGPVGLPYEAPERPPLHPRGRLREVLRKAFWIQFGAVGHSVPRNPGEAIYKWHLQEARILSNGNAARELNELADLFEGMAEGAGLGPEAVGAFEEAAAITRSKADAIEDSIDTIEVEL